MDGTGAVALRAALVDADTDAEPSGISVALADGTGVDIAASLALIAGPDAVGWGTEDTTGGAEDIAGGAEVAAAAVVATAGALDTAGITDVSSV